MWFRRWLDGFNILWELRDPKNNFIGKWATSWEKKKKIKEKKKRLSNGSPGKMLCKRLVIYKKYI